MTAVYGYDNLYNESINDIALLNYNKGIAQRLRMQENVMHQKLPFKEPQMLGGVRASNTILAGTTAEPPTTLAVGGRAFRTFRGDESPAEGGKINRLKKAKRWLGFTKDVINEGFNIFDKGKSRMGGKKFNLIRETKGLIKKGKNLYEKNKVVKGIVDFGVGELKKNKVIRNLANKVPRILGKIEKGDVRGLVNEGVDIYDQYKGMGGMVYSPALRDALAKKPRKTRVEKLDGGARKPRTGRMAKGSPEALAFGQRMKALREAKKRG